MPHDDSKKPAKASRRRLSLALVAIGLALVLYGGLGLYQRFHATHGSQPAQAAASQTVNSTTDHPSEAPISGDYTVAADMPRSIILPSLNVQGFIQKVATDQHGAIAAPNNVNLAGWYTGSPKPGQDGVSIVDGHVQGYYSPGVFKKLAKLKPDDIITIEYGDHSKKDFKVIRSDNLPVEKVSSEQYVQLPGVNQQLTVITCAGQYDKTTSSYGQRTLVRASLIKT